LRLQSVIKARKKSARILFLLSYFSIFVEICKQQRKNRIKLYKKPKVICFDRTLLGAAERRPKPLPEAGVWGWVRFANAAGGRKVGDGKQYSLKVM
jgi:hypothetical protein